LAVPMWMLFEIGLLCSRLFVPKAGPGGHYPVEYENLDGDD